MVLLFHMCTLTRRLYKESHSDEHFQENAGKLVRGLPEALGLECGRSNGNIVSFEINGEALTVPTARGVNLAVINLEAWLPSLLNHKLWCCRVGKLELLRSLNAPIHGAVASSG